MAVCHSGWRTEWLLRDWGYLPPGFVEVDFVAHSGTSAVGTFVQTLVLTDIATGWTRSPREFIAAQTATARVSGETRARSRPARFRRSWPKALEGLVHSMWPCWLPVLSGIPPCDQSKGP